MLFGKVGSRAKIDEKKIGAKSEGNSEILIIKCKFGWSLPPLGNKTKYTFEPWIHFSIKSLNKRL